MFDNVFFPAWKFKLLPVANTVDLLLDLGALPLPMLGFFSHAFHTLHTVHWKQAFTLAVCSPFAILRTLGFPTQLNWVFLSLKFCLVKSYIFFRPSVLLNHSNNMSVPTIPAQEDLLVLKVWVYLFTWVCSHFLYGKSMGGLYQFRREDSKPLFIIGSHIVLPIGF